MAFKSVDNIICLTLIYKKFYIFKARISEGIVNSPSSLLHGLGCYPVAVSQTETDSFPCLLDRPKSHFSIEIFVYFLE